jgi:phenylpropionate dioxygenase-like ring-hydroxylating dioxygenase large terminal subunit
LCGGKVEGDALVCPFHLWEFAPTGQVTKVPWLDEPPAHIKAKTYPFAEFHGMVCVWFHAEAIPPSYDLPPVDTIASGAMRPCGSWEVDRPIYMVSVAVRGIEAHRGSQKGGLADDLTGSCV